MSVKLGCAFPGLARAHCFGTQSSGPSSACIQCHIHVQPEQDWGNRARTGVTGAVVIRVFLEDYRRRVHAGMKMTRACGWQGCLGQGCLGFTRRSHSCCKYCRIAFVTVAVWWPPACMRHTCTSIPPGGISQQQQTAQKAACSSSSSRHMWWYHARNHSSKMTLQVYFSSDICKGNRQYALTAVHGVEVHDALRALAVIARQHPRVGHQHQAPVQVVMDGHEQPVLGEDVHPLHAMTKAVDCLPEFHSNAMYGTKQPRLFVILTDAEHGPHSGRP